MSLETYLVISALGSDRPGLAAAVSAFISARGGNVEDSRMAVLGAEFGIMVLVAGEVSAIAIIEQEHAALGAETGLEITMRRTVSPTEHRRAEVVPCIVTAETLDHEGVAAAVTRALHQAGTNIVQLDCQAYEAPVTGSQLFRMEARVDVPAKLRLSALRKLLEEVAEEENLDIDVRSLMPSRS